MARWGAGRWRRMGRRVLGRALWCGRWWRDGWRRRIAAEWCRLDQFLVAKEKPISCSQEIRKLLANRESGIKSGNYQEKTRKKPGGQPVKITEGHGAKGSRRGNRRKPKPGPAVFFVCPHATARKAPRPVLISQNEATQNKPCFLLLGLASGEWRLVLLFGVKAVVLFRLPIGLALGGALSSSLLPPSR